MTPCRQARGSNGGVVMCPPPWRWSELTKEAIRAQKYPCATPFSSQMRLLMEAHESLWNCPFDSVTLRGPKTISRLLRRVAGKTARESFLPSVLQPADR